MGREVSFALTGELDLVSKPAVAAALGQLLGDGVDVVVDCSDLTFIDSSGIHVLIDVRNSLEAAGHRLRITNVSGSPRRVFEILGLEDLFGIEPDDGSPPSD